MSKTISLAVLQEAATNYRSLMLHIKELEKHATPFKKQLTDYAAEAQLIAPLDLGAVTLEPRTLTKSTIDKSAVSPDWLYRMQRDGYFSMISVSIEQKAVALLSKETISLRQYLEEIGYAEKQTPGYAI